LGVERTREKYQEKEQERWAKTIPADHGLHRMDIEKEKRGPFSFENRPRKSKCG